MGDALGGIPIPDWPQASEALLAALNTGLPPSVEHPPAVADYAGGSLNSAPPLQKPYCAAVASVDGLAMGRSVRK